MPNKSCAKCAAPLGENSRSEVCPVCESEATIDTASPASGGQPSKGPDSNLGETIKSDSECSGTDGGLPETITGGDARNEPLSTEASSEPIIPFQFGDYEVESELARGGMGVVFKARQLSLNRPVALKMILSAQLASQDEVQRFQTEAEAAAKLDHPTIVPVYEVGQHGSQHYFSMGLVEGGSLTDLVSDGPIPARHAAELVREVAYAVHYAHARNIVHRDLKPANVLIDDQGRPKITDFGLAKKVGEDSGLTATGQVMGTPSYMPPEQAEGKTEEVGPLSDIYSLGAILYFLLTGRPPFQGNSLVETLRLVVQEEVVSPQRFNRMVDVDLAAVCTKCLEKDPQRRYGSAAALGDELDRWLHGRAITARPIGPSDRLIKWVRRKPVLASLWLVVLLFVLILSIGGPLVALHTSGLYAEAEAARSREDVKLYYSEMANAHTLITKGDPQSASNTLEKYVPNTGERDHRGWEWSHLMSLVREFDPDEKLEVHDLSPKWGRKSFFSSDGKRLAIPGGRKAGGSIRIWDLDSTELVRTLELIQSACRHPTVFAWSPDDRRIAFPASASEIQIMDVDKGEILTRFHGHTSEPAYMSWSPDGTRLASATKDGELLVWDLDSKDDQQLARLQWPDDIYHIEWSPKSDCFVALKDKIFTLVSRDGEPLTDDGPGWNLAPLVPEWNSDGTSVLGCFNEAEETFVGIWNPWLSGADWLISLTPTSDAYMSACWISDGHEVVTIGRRVGRLKFWDPKTRGMTRPTIEAHNASGVTVRSFPNGIVSADKRGSVRVWQVDREHIEQIGHFEQGLGIGWAIIGPNSELLLSAGFEQGINIVRLAQQSLRSHQREIQLAGDVGWISWSPDDKLLATAPWQASYHEEAITTQVWDVETGQKRFSIDAGPCVVWNANGTELASGIDQWLCQTWDLNGNPKRVMRRQVDDPDVGEDEIGPAKSATQVSWSPDGTVLAMGNRLDGVALWDTREKRVTRTLPGTDDIVSSTAVRWSPDGLMLAAVMSVRGGGDDELYLYEARDYSVKWKLRIGDDSITDLTWSPDSAKLAIGLSNTFIDILDVTSGEKLHRHAGHSQPVNSVDWSPDGKHIASGSEDGTIRIWKPGLHHEAFVLPGHGTKPVKAVRWSHDSGQIASAGFDRTIRIWDARQYYLQLPQ